MTIPLVLICAAPRTGTNHLCRVLSGFDRLKVRTEVFARDVAFSMDPGDIRALIDITGCQVPIDPASPTTTQLVYDEPSATICALWRTRAPEHKALTIKLFGYHLPRGWTKGYLEAGAVPLVVKRRKIDAYASKRKAQHLQQWTHADTTLLQVTADVRDYEYWNARHADWYAHVESVGIHPFHLDYDRDINVPVPELVDRLTQTLGEAVDLGPWREVRGLPKQDRNVRVEDKIANWDEFAAALEERGLLDDAFGTF